MIGCFEGGIHTIPGAIIQQRILLRSIERHYLANEDAVVASGENIYQSTLDISKRFIEDWRACHPRMVAHAVELFIAPYTTHGKACCQVALILGQQIRCEIACLPDGVVNIGVAINTDQHERRIERERREGVDGDAQRMTIAHGCHNGDTRGEAAQHRTKISFTNAHHNILTSYASSHEV